MSTTKRQNIALQNSLMKVAKIKHQLVREFLAETLGTFILVLFGNGAIAQFKGQGMYLFIYVIMCCNQSVTEDLDLGTWMKISPFRYVAIFLFL